MAGAGRWALVETLVVLGRTARVPVGLYDQLVMIWAGRTFEDPSVLPQNGRTDPPTQRSARAAAPTAGCAGRKENFSPCFCDQLIVGTVPWERTGED